MSGKRKSLETIAAEEVELDYDGSDERIGLIDEHVAEHFGFVRADNRVHFYQWLESYIALHPQRASAPEIGLVNSKKSKGQLLSADKVKSVFQQMTIEGELKDLWVKGRRAIAKRSKDLKKTEDEKRRTLPITIMNKDRARFEKLKTKLDDSTNEAVLIELMDMAESFDKMVNTRVKEKHEKLLKENKKLKQQGVKNPFAAGDRARLNALEDALELLLGSSFSMSVKEYIDFHRQQENLKAAHEKISEESDVFKGREA